MASAPKTSSADREGGAKKCWPDAGIVGKSLKVWPDWPIPVKAWTAPGVSKTQSPTERACAMWTEFPRKSPQEKSDPETFISQQILHHTLSTLHSEVVAKPQMACSCPSTNGNLCLQRERSPLDTPELAHPGPRRSKPQFWMVGCDSGLSSQSLCLLYLISSQKHLVGTIWETPGCQGNSRVELKGASDESCVGLCCHLLVCFCGSTLSLWDHRIQLGSTMERR